MYTYQGSASSWQWTQLSLLGMSSAEVWEVLFKQTVGSSVWTRSAFDDPSVTMKWEQWDTMDYSRRNLVGTGPFPLNPQQQQGVPLRFISPFLLFGQIIVQNSLNPDINWVGLYLMSTRQLWMWFICSSFVHNMAKDLHMVWAATVKMRSELRKKFEGTFLLPLVFSCGCKLTLQLFSLLVLVYLQFGNVFLD